MRGSPTPSSSPNCALTVCLDPMLAQWLILASHQAVITGDQQCCYLRRSAPVTTLPSPGCWDGSEAEGGGVHWSEGCRLPPCLCGPHFLQPCLPTRHAMHVSCEATSLPVTQGGHMHVSCVTCTHTHGQTEREGHSKPRLISCLGHFSYR